jgi:hypothetical protein
MSTTAPLTGFIFLQTVVSLPENGVLPCLPENVPHVSQVFRDIGGLHCPARLEIWIDQHFGPDVSHSLLAVDPLAVEPGCVNIVIHKAHELVHIFRACCLCPILVRFFDIIGWIGCQGEKSL